MKPGPACSRCDPSESNPDTLALWLEVVGQSDGEYTYDMWFQAPTTPAPTTPCSTATRSR